MGIHPEAWCTWACQAEVDQGTHPGVMTDQAEWIKEFEAGNRELRRANAILKSALAFFVVELNRSLR